MEHSYAAVMAVLKDYFDGLYYSDTTRLARAFHPDAQYVTVTDGTLLHLGMKDYFAVVDKRPAPASRNEPRTDEICEISFAGPVTVTARLHCSIAERYFTDCLTLIHIDGRWQIISKVFHYDIREV